MNFNILDFPTAWQLCRDGCGPHDEKCSFLCSSGALLCDCGAVRCEWERRKLEHQQKTPLIKTTIQSYVELVARCSGCNGELQTTFYEPDMLKVKPCGNCCCNRPMYEESPPSLQTNSNEVYSRAECLFNYCPSPEICADRCKHPAKGDHRL